jgi:hypothetical protein
MSNRWASFLVGAVAVFLCFENVHAQQDHTCSNHNSFFFGCPGFKSYGPWKGVEKISVVSVEEIVYQEDNDNCSCGDASWSKVTKTNVTHKIGVNGEVTVGLKSGLATALIAKAKSTVKIGANWEGSWEEACDVTINKTMPQCTKHQYKYYKVKHVASGSQEEAEDVWSDSKGHSGFCNKKIAKGSSTGWTGGRGVFSSPGPCSGFPCDNPSKSCAGYQRASR